MKRGKEALVMALSALALVLPAGALADHSTVELLSVGPDGGNHPSAVNFRGASADGAHVFFETSESLVSADSDSRIDVYERYGGVTSLVSTGSPGGNGGFNAFFAGTSSDGTRVFFGTAEKLAGSDTDSVTDIYERSGGVTTQVSTGPAGGSGAFPAYFDGASGDGTRVFFHTTEKLVFEDPDSQPDVYQRSAGTTTLVSTGSEGGGSFPALFDGASQDGGHVFFETQEALEGTDGDTFVDVYDRSGGVTTQVSIGSSGGSGPSDAFFDGSSADGTRVFFTTDEQLEPTDTDSQLDSYVYQVTTGLTTQISVGPAGGNGTFDALFVDASEDGSRVFFETDEGLVGGDVDNQVDIYQRSGVTTTLISTGPAGGNGSFDAFFAGASSDGTHVFFETDEILVVDDVDAQFDVYERSGGVTTQVSAGPGGGNGAFDADFRGASADGGRVFFRTDESLTSQDTDANRDVYERSASDTTLVSGGLTGGNGAFNASYAGASQDGTRLLFVTNERLVGEDTDSSQDIYVASPVPAYPRPGSASPLRVPLVPAFEACTAPNSTHVAPLDSPSCNPPTLRSSLLTTSTIGRGGAFARLDVLPGNPGTPADEADINIAALATDVVNASGGSDYTGKLILTTTTRITDRASSSFQTTPATVEDTRLSIPIDCVATPNPAVGSSCSVNTTADTLVPGLVKEGKRTVISAFSVALLDAGADGSVAPPSGSCPPTCGSGDENPYLVQGIFAP
jgi:hypothetical protein